MDRIFLLVKGLSSFIFRKRNNYTLSISNSPFSQVVTQIMKFCQLQSLILFRVDIDHDDEVIFSSYSTREWTDEISSTKYLSLISLLVFQPSSLSCLTLFIEDDINPESTLQLHAVQEH